MRDCPHLNKNVLCYNKECGALLFCDNCFSSHNSSIHKKEINKFVIKDKIIKDDYLLKKKIDDYVSTKLIDGQEVFKTINSTKIFEIIKSFETKMVEFITEFEELYKKLMLIFSEIEHFWLMKHLRTINYFKEKRNIFLRKDIYSIIKDKTTEQSLIELREHILQVNEISRISSGISNSSSILTKTQHLEFHAKNYVQNLELMKEEFELLISKSENEIKEMEIVSSINYKPNNEFLVPLSSKSNTILSQKLPFETSWDSSFKSNSNQIFHLRTQKVDNLEEEVILNLTLFSETQGKTKETLLFTR